MSLRSTNQTNEISPHTCQSGYYQKFYKKQVLERMWEKKEAITHCW